MSSMEKSGVKKDFNHMTDFSKIVKAHLSELLLQFCNSSSLRVNFKNDTVFERNSFLLVELFYNKKNFLITFSD